MELLLPRLRVMVGGLRLPGSFLLIPISCSEFSMKSMTSISEVMPTSSLNCAISVPSTVIEKREAAMASLGLLPNPVGMVLLLLAQGRAARELGDAEDDELRRFHRRDADLDDQL